MDDSHILNFMNLSYLYRCRDCFLLTGGEMDE